MIAKRLASVVSGAKPLFLGDHHLALFILNNDELPGVYYYTKIS